MHITRATVGGFGKLISTGIRRSMRAKRCHCRYLRTVNAFMALIFNYQDPMIDYQLLRTSAARCGAREGQRLAGIQRKARREVPLVGAGESLRTDFLGPKAARVLVEDVRAVKGGVMSKSLSWLPSGSFGILDSYRDIKTITTKRSGSPPRQYARWPEPKIEVSDCQWCQRPSSSRA